MKWVDGLTWERKAQIKSSWQPWFAWYPVRIGTTNDQHKIYMWLQRVFRKGTYIPGWFSGSWTYEYKEKI